jgi:two-component system, response regulator YesN
MRLSLMDSEVQRACLHIEKKFNDPLLSPQSVCAAIITGEPFLETLFEKELGMSISAYINHVRIHRAKLLLTATPETGSQEMAAQVGFSESSEFETQFKLVEGGDFAAYCREKRSPS